MAVVIETDRLVLRRWGPSDAEPFATLNADPRVMEFFPNTLSRNESNAIIDIIETRINRGLGSGPLK